MAHNAVPCKLRICQLGGMSLAFTADGSLSGRRRVALGNVTTGRQLVPVHDTRERPALSSSARQRATSGLSVGLIKQRLEKLYKVSHKINDSTAQPRDIWKLTD